LATTTTRSPCPLGWRTQWTAPSNGSPRGPARPWGGGCGVGGGARGRGGRAGAGGGWAGGGALRCLDPERSADSGRAAGGVPAGRADRRGGGGEDRKLGGRHGPEWRRGGGTRAGL